MRKVGLLGVSVALLALAGISAGSVGASQVSCSATMAGNVYNGTTGKDLIVQPNKTCVIGPLAVVNNVIVLSKGALAVRANAQIGGNVIATNPRWITFEPDNSATPEITVDGNVIIMGTTASPSGVWGGINFNGGLHNTICNVDIGQNLKLVANKKFFEVGDVFFFGGNSCDSAVNIGENAIVVGNTGKQLGLASPFDDPQGISIAFGDLVTIGASLICVGDHPDAAASDLATADQAIGEQCENATTP